MNDELTIMNYLGVPTACTEPCRSGRAIRYIFFEKTKKDAASIPHAILISNIEL